ncbi:hypothetical protein [Paenibacillus ginsengihumi]|uniref:hypothetical protein n=1 Tax=Paenibacillus ginsengihumi TaxID=431596 RepID=UPI0012EC64DC|nr:hypothetical protein [Paenibacillus ginsengihumi]
MPIADGANVAAWFDGQWFDGTVVGREEVCGKYLYLVELLNGKQIRLWDHEVTPA